jgi:NAD(P)H-hydrate epimerase
VHRLDDLAVPAAAWQGLGARAKAYGSDALSNWLRPRPRDSHKNRFGHVLCVGGDIGMGGAIRLCAEAALRSGAGVVSVATRSDNVVALVSARPEAMVRPVEDADDFPPLLTRADVVALGPGLGQGDWGRALWRATLASGKALVLDADALNLLADAPRELPDAVLTPHPGEAARLLGCTGAEIQADRFAAAAALAERYQAVVVLKGAGSIVAAPGRTPAVIAAGNPGMAVAGMGDLLTGAVAALRAQGLSPFDAAVCGALLHASAGDAAAGDGQRGLLPSDLLPELRRLANPERTGR